VGGGEAATGVLSGRKKRKMLIKSKKQYSKNPLMTTTKKTAIKNRLGMGAKAAGTPLDQKKRHSPLSPRRETRRKSTNTLAKRERFLSLFEEEEKIGKREESGGP